MHRFIAARSKIDRKLRARLAPLGPPDLVVSFITEKNEPGVAENLVVLGWDRPARRWAKVFDAGGPTQNRSPRGVQFQRGPRLQDALEMGLTGSTHHSGAGPYGPPTALQITTPVLSAWSKSA